MAFLPWHQRRNPIYLQHQAEPFSTHQEAKCTWDPCCTVLKSSLERAKTWIRKEVKGTVTQLHAPKQQLFVCAEQRRRFDVSLASVSATSNLCIQGGDFQVAGSPGTGQVGPAGSLWSNRGEGTHKRFGCRAGWFLHWNRSNGLRCGWVLSFPAQPGCGRGMLCLFVCLLPEAAYLPTHHCSTPLDS